MKCYVHREEEAVVTCAKCGVAMCHACEEKALAVLNNAFSSQAWHIAIPHFAQLTTASSS